MSFIDELLSYTHGCSCGLCCFNDIPCDKCLENTLQANNIDLIHIEKFRGLKNKATRYTEQFRFSELCLSIKEHNQLSKSVSLIKEE